MTSRPVRPRETLLLESATLTGPSLVTTPVCPSCLAPLHSPFYPCTKCNLPVCSPSCQEHKNHIQECRLLSENRVKINITDGQEVSSIYSFILPYRLLKLRTTDQEAWKRVASLPDHIAQRVGTGEWDMNQKDVVNFIRRRCFLGKVSLF